MAIIAPLLLVMLRNHYQMNKEDCEASPYDTEVFSESDSEKVQIGKDKKDETTLKDGGILQLFMDVITCQVCNKKTTQKDTSVTGSGNNSDLKNLDSDNVSKNEPLEDAQFGNHIENVVQEGDQPNVRG